MLTTSGRQKLVYLNALRAFEAAARLSSFVSAAAELNVTPSAISQHIKAFEDYLGMKLFVRSKSGVALTPAAREAYPDIRDGLESLGAGLARLKSPGADRIVTMTIPPSFGAKWLLPRIDSFREIYPELDIRLDTTNRLVDFHAEQIDIGVRYGRGHYPGMKCERLLDEEVFPVCSPRLLPPKKARLELRHLGSMTLIHDTTIDFEPSFPTWRAWLSARELSNVDFSRGIQVNSSVLAIQAAIDGQGVALGRSVIVDGDIRAGRLVKPFDVVDESGCAYFVIYPRQSPVPPKVTAVRDWLFSEVAADTRRK
jgi:LysR family glycine cleavage system transcriptional activator